MPYSPIAPSLTALRTNNPIRGIVESLVKPDLPDKPFIALSLGACALCLLLRGSGLAKQAASGGEVLQRRAGMQRRSAGRRAVAPFSCRRPELISSLWQQLSSCLQAKKKMLFLAHTTWHGSHNRWLTAAGSQPLTVITEPHVYRGHRLSRPFAC